MVSDQPPISRRDWLRGDATRRGESGEGGCRESNDSGRAPVHRGIDESREANPPGGRFPRTFPIHRPPGAIEESSFLTECTRCEACIEACPHDAIVLAPARYRGAAGTPMIDAASAPCRMCPDTPCIAACEPGVLRGDLGPRGLVMGEARIHADDCLAFTGSFCTVCSEQCPVSGAIEVREGKPRIIAEVCTGCGVCHHVCPAPINAVMLLPASPRPPRPG